MGRRVTSTCRGAGEIGALPDHQLDAELEPQAAQSEGERLDEAVGQRVRQVAQEHGEVDPEGVGLTGGPRLPVPFGGLDVCGRHPAT